MSKLAQDLIVHSRHPFNVEPALDRLRAAFMTAAAGSTTARRSR
jgi:hypothetical protein